MPNGGHAEPDPGQASGHPPPVTALLQLQFLIQQGLASAHGTPLNESYYDHVAKVWNLAWKWGTWSCWVVSEDIHVLLIRYAELCLNGDMELVIPTYLMEMGRTAPDCPVEDRQNPFWYISTYIQTLVADNVLDDVGKEEARQYAELLASKTAAAAVRAHMQQVVHSPASPVPDTAAEVNALLMTDNKHCVTSGGATWNGPTNGNLKEKLLESYTAQLADFLQNIDENSDGFAGNGWVT
eukprot:3303837-Heterocapsa_arctica.AAC.1